MERVPPPPNDLVRLPALVVVADAIARIIKTREALADGNRLFAAELLEDLELDLVGWRERLEERRAA